MVNHKLKLLLSIFCFVHSLSADDFNEKGFRLGSNSLSKKFFLMKKTPSPDFISDYIKKINSSVPIDEGLEISTEILRSANCFQIDPWILTSLIQKESSFKKTATSPTNAAGLTQFTTFGFKEVNDQLGFRGTEAASLVAILYFNSQLTSCIDSNWFHLWTRLAVPENHPDFYNLAKEEIKNDIQLAVVYGAILLKTYLGHIDQKRIKENIPMEMSEIYFQALQMYNGEEGNAKIIYAKNVFKNLQGFYPLPVIFSFLD